MIGCAAKIRSILTDPGTGSIRNTLLIAPPRCGKTTLLRDLIRMVSDGEEGKDRGSALRGALNGLRQVQDMKIKLEKWWR